MNFPLQKHLQRLWAPYSGLFVAAFANDLSVACVALAIQWHAIRLHAVPLELGLLGTFGAAAYTLGCIFTGSVSDVWGRRKPMLLACLVCPTVWLLMTQTAKPYQLLLLGPWASFSLALFWPPLQAWLAEFAAGSRQRLNRIMAIFNIAWSMGIMLGPLLAGFLWQWRWPSAFVLPALFTAALVPVLMRTPLPQHVSALEPEETHTISPQRAQLYLYLAWIGNFASWFARGTVNTMFPKLADTLNFPHPLVGTLIFLLSLAQTIAFLAARSSARWQYRLLPLWAAELLGLSGMALAAMTERAVLFAVGFILCGICSGMTYVSSLIYALAGVRENRGRRSAWHEAVLGLGIVVGPLVGGTLGQTIDLHAPFAGSASVFGLAMLAQFLLWRTHNKNTNFWRMAIKNKTLVDSSRCCASQ